MAKPNPALDSSTRPRRGRADRWVVAGLITLGLACAVFAWLYYARLERQPIEFWGTTTAQLITRAPRVELLVLAAADGNDAQPGPKAAEKSATGTEQIEIDGRRYAVVRAVDATQARGFSHFRRALLRRPTYDWSEALGECQDEAPFALRFTDGGSTATIVLSTHCSRAINLETGRAVSIRPLTERTQAFFDELLETKRDAKEGTESK